MTVPISNSLPPGHFRAATLVQTATSNATSSTVPEMPAVRDSMADFGDGDLWDEDTDVHRLTASDSPPTVQAPRNRAVLVRADGAHAGQVCTLESGPLSLGRHVSSDLCIHDHGVSRQHARIVVDGTRFVLEDLGSRNGTFVRGKRVTRAELRDGDQIHLGPRVTYRFSVVDADEESLLRQLFQSSTRDALTGAYNRRHFDERLRGEVAFALRHDTDVSLVMLDIDHFKRVNDEFGHPAGDGVLRHVSRLAMRQLRTEDVFARFGGEEFAVILRGISLAGALRAAERIRATVEVLPTPHEGRVIPVTLSGGCSSLRSLGAREGEDLVAAADRRLYAAKVAGRNQVMFRD